MDHTDVVRLQAAEKYVLGELTPELREQFEEHYFDCPTCAVDLISLAQFVNGSKEIFSEDARAKAKKAGESQSETVERRGWFAWLRPAIALPAMGALAAVLIFQTVVTIPKLKQEAASRQTAQVYETSFRVQGLTRGETVSKVTVGPNESFGLEFDFTPSETFPSYRGSLVGPTGETVLGFEVSGAEANKELHVVVPRDQVQAGTYELVFTGENGASGLKKEVQRLSFVVEIQGK